MGAWVVTTMEREYSLQVCVLGGGGGQCRPAARGAGTARGHPEASAGRRRHAGTPAHKPRPAGPGRPRWHTGAPALCPAPARPLWGRPAPPPHLRSLPCSLASRSSSPLIQWYVTRRPSCRGARVARVSSAQQSTPCAPAGRKTPRGSGRLAAQRRQAWVSLLPGAPLALPAARPHCWPPCLQPDGGLPAQLLQDELVVRVAAAHALGAGDVLDALLHALKAHHHLHHAVHAHLRSGLGRGGQGLGRRSSNLFRETCYCPASCGHAHLSTAHPRRLLTGFSQA